MIVKIDQDAIDSLRETIDSDIDHAEYVRVYVTSSCCKGPSFGLTLDDLNEDDLLDDSKSVPFIISREAYEQVGDIVIETSGKGYKIESVNPPESKCGSCGCGKW